MKAIAIAAVIAFCSGTAARASNFGVFDPASPQTSAGTFISMDGTGSAAGLAVAAVTHKVPASDNVLAAFIHGWVPLTIGGTLGAGLGGPSVAAGTGLNLLPAAQAGLRGIIGALARPGALSSLQAALQAKDSPVALFVGPQYNLVFTAPNKCYGKPTWFVGASVTWK